MLWQPDMNPMAVAGLAGTRTYPLNSSFQPTYNMAVNLVGQVGRARAAKLLESSFAQFQADRGVVGLASQAGRLRRQAAGIEVSCDRGDLESYDTIRRELGQLERSEGRGSAQASRRAEAIESLEKLRPGDIIDVPAGRQAGVAIVLQRGGADGERPAPLVLTIGRQVKRLSVADFPVPVSAYRLDQDPAVVQPRGQPEPPAVTWCPPCATSSAGSDQADPRQRGRGPAGRLMRDRRSRRPMRRSSHCGGGCAATTPSHGCPDLQLHLRDLERRARLDREATGLESRVSGRSHVLARTFGRVCSVLEDLGYMAGDEVTAEGRRLAALYTELDLLAADVPAPRRAGPGSA